MELQFLGTGAGSPSRARNVSSLALKLLDERNEVWLFDIGEGTQHQILRTNIRPRKVGKIFLTHLHGDHLFGLPGFLASRANQGGNEPLTIYGPAGVDRFVRASLQVSQTRLPYKLNFVVLEKEGLLFEDKTFRVYFAPMAHRIPSFGFRIEEKDHEGELLIDRVVEAGIPKGPVYARLKAGEDVTLPDGRSFSGRDFIGPKQKGRVVTIIGDTRANRESQKLAMGADVLVHEATFGADSAAMARQYHHSTNIEAAKIAKAAGVHQLLLNHISARYVGKAAAELQQDAQRIFSNTLVVHDMQSIDVPFKRGEDE